MSFTPANVITEVRRAVQDEVEPYRYSDIHMLGVINQSLKRICLIRPDLFTYIASIVCVVGAVQAIPADGVRLVDIIGTGGNLNVAEVNQESVDLMFVAWPAGATGPASNWMRNVRNPTHFYIYPPSPAGQEIVIEYVQAPRAYALTDTIALLTDVYFPCVVDCAVYLLEAVDNEHVDSGRAKLFQDSFMQLLGLTVQTKPIIDSPYGGEDPKMVL